MGGDLQITARFNMKYSRCKLQDRRARLPRPRPPLRAQSRPPQPRPEGLCASPVHPPALPRQRTLQKHSIADPALPSGNSESELIFIPLIDNKQSGQRFSTVHVPQSKPSAFSPGSVSHAKQGGSVRRVGSASLRFCAASARKADQSPSFCPSHMSATRSTCVSFR